MKRPSPRAAVVVILLVLVAGFGAARLLRTTTTEISESDALDRYERATESADGDDAAVVAGVTESAEPESEEETADDSAIAAADQAEPAAPAAEDSEPAAPAAEDLAPVAPPLPRPGVYPVALTGGEQLALATGADRVYPAEGFVTVTPVECGVDVRTDFILERWQSIELCATDAGVELGTERIFHSFFGLDDLLERVCVGSPLSSDASSWLCESSSSVAERAVTVETATRDVAGQPRDVLVFTTELVRGDHPDNIELIELWIDVETGLPAREARTYDFVLETPLGDAGYTEEYVWELTSLEPLD